MSNSMTINDSSRFSGQQKMNFSQTCNLLSQYVKDKRAFGIPTNLDAADADAAAASLGGATMNLFPQFDDSNGSVGRTINLFPQISGFNSSGNKRASSEPTAPQMTIFYGGQVGVFNDLPADKAKEVMDLASRFESSLNLKKRKVETPVSAVSVSVPVANIKPITNPIPVAEAVRRGLVPSVADLPIARKASLHRFLEKRKYRLVSEAPQTANVSGNGASKPVEGKAWLGLNSLPIFQQEKKQEQQL